MASEYALRSLEYSENIKGGEMVSSVFILLTILTGLSSYTLYKIWKVHLLQFELLSKLQEEEQLGINLFRQIQSYDNLMKILGPTISLPPLRGWAASPDFLLVLAKHVRQEKPKVIIECGSGASSVVLAQCVKLNGEGQVFSLEHDPKYAQKTRELLKQNKLKNYVTVVDASLKKYSRNGKTYQWYSLENLPKLFEIDMLVIDGPPAHVGDKARYLALPKFIDKFSNSCNAFLDDAGRETERSCIKSWSEEFKRIKVKYIDCEKGCAQISLS